MNIVKTNMILKFFGIMFNIINCVLFYKLNNVFYPLGTISLFVYCICQYNSRKEYPKEVIISSIIMIGFIILFG